jgi:hypothetical protein
MKDDDNTTLIEEEQREWGTRHVVIVTGRARKNKNTPLYAFMWTT